MGAGTFGTVAVTDGGRFSPGNSPGTTTVAGATFGAGGGFVFELNSAHATPGNGADFLNSTGPLTISAGITPNSRFTIELATLGSSHEPAPLSGFNPSQHYTFRMATAAGGINGFDAAKFSLNTGNFMNSLDGGSFSVGQSGNDLLLQFTPVPEPTTAALVLMGGALLLRPRRC